MYSRIATERYESISASSSDPSSSEIVDTLFSDVDELRENVTVLLNICGEVVPGIGTYRCVEDIYCGRRLLDWKFPEGRLVFRYFQKVGDIA